MCNVNLYIKVAPVLILPKSEAARSRKLFIALEMLHSFSPVSLQVAAKASARLHVNKMLFNFSAFILWMFIRSYLV